LNTALASHALEDASIAARLEAAQTLQRSAPPALLPLLEQRYAHEEDGAVHDALALALANLQLASPDATVRLKAVRLLGETGEPLAKTRLQTLLDGDEADPAVRKAAETSLAQVERKLFMGRSEEH